jgi:outer membrane protein assembly factor BamA
LDLSLGFSSQQLFSLRLEGRDRNLLGSMFDGSASLDLGLFIGRFTQVRNQLRWPRMLGTDFSLSYTPLALTYNDQPAGVILQAPSTGAAQKASAAWDQPDPRRRLFAASTSVGLDWRASSIAPVIDDKLTVGIAVEARGDWLQVAGPYIEPLSLQALETVDGLTTLFAGDAAVDPASVFAFTPRIAFSNIDNPFDPKSGLGAELFVRGVPFGLIPYAVVGAQGRSYFSFLNDRLTLATNLRIRAGVVSPYDGCPEPGERCEWAIMQNDLLRVGGERSVRGVEENQVGTPGSIYGQDLSVTLDDEGTPIRGIRPGLFGAVANVELRFTLVKQLFLGDVKPAIFTDVGFSSDDFAFEAKDTTAFLAATRYAISFGTGIRYVLPVGPLAFDVAWSPFDKQTSTLPLRYSLTLGYIF